MGRGNNNVRNIPSNNNTTPTKQPLEWRTITLAVDRETGEILDKDNLKDYLILRKQISYRKTSKTHGIRTIRYECKRNNQLEIKW